MIYMLKYIKESIQMSITDFEMHPKMQWIERYIDRGIDIYVAIQMLKENATV
jgi:hypothetical protein